MTTVIPISVERIPPIGRAEAATLAKAEYARLLDLLRGLRPADWEQPTDCTRWTVKDIAAHVLGMAEALTSLRELGHQLRLAARVQREIGASDPLDGLNEVQVRDRRQLSTRQLIDRLAAKTPKAARIRAALPAPVRAIPISAGPPIGRRSIAYLLDLVLTRDVWMHRIDIARAAGAPITLTADHDGRLVADMVADWAKTHDEPFVLNLSGPAGGIYYRGQTDAPVHIDAVEFIRILSGRATGGGVLANPLPL